MSMFFKISAVSNCIDNIIFSKVNQKDLSNWMLSNQRFIRYRAHNKAFWAAILENGRLWLVHPKIYEKSVPGTQVISVKKIMS